MAIPKIMHFLWVGGKMPKVYEKAMTSFVKQHPDWKVCMWDDETFTETFGHELILYQEALDAMQFFVQKTDLYRLLILKKYGGFYSDVDVVFFGNFDKYCKHDFVAFREKLTNKSYEHKSHCTLEGHAIANGFMGAGNNSKIVQFMLGRIRELKIEYHPSNKVAFGPKLIEEVVHDFLLLDDDVDIHIGEPDILYPMNKESTVDTMNFTENTLAWHWYNSCNDNASKKFDKYILGGGISSLVFAYINPEFKIITPEVGGKLKTKFISSTMLLHKSTATIKMLKELGVNFDIITHHMRYIDDKRYLTEIEGADRLTMIKKKMTPWDELPVLRKFDVKDNNLSTENNQIELVSVNSADLVSILEEKVSDRIITGMCKQITSDTIVCDDQTYFYDKLICTIPLPIFKKIYDKVIPNRTNGMPVTFVVSSDFPKQLAGAKFDLVYNFSTTKIWTRLNKHADKYLYEITGDISRDSLAADFEDISSYHVEKYGIVESDKLESIDNILFIGRFARWQHDFKINDAIKMAYDYAEKRKDL